MHFIRCVFHCSRGIAKLRRMNRCAENSEWMHLPDYTGHSIVNLMASLSLACHGGSTGYATVPGTGLANLPRARNIVLLIIDGLGHDFLMHQCRGSLLNKYCLGELSSVCPSTTASAIPTFLTGLPPQQHGFTGWFTYFSEIGSVLAVLPHRTRIGNLPLDEAALSPASLSGAASFFSSIPISSTQIIPDIIAGSSFNRAFSGRAQVAPFAGLSGLRTALRRALTRGRERRLIYAYWPEFDSLAHQFGVGSPQVQYHFLQLDLFFRDLLRDLQGSDTILLVTADHGFIDTAQDRSIHLEQHPELQQTLMVPLCGESRLAFCYVHPGLESEFETYVREHFADQAALLPSRQLLEAGWFGLGAPHPMLQHRIGHYALVMKGNWMITGRLPGERPLHHIGVHGGVSAEEMYVPLVYAEC